MKLYTLIITLTIAFVFSLNAQIIHVPADQSTIQSGINAANIGDTVLVDEGTYFENIKFLGKAITLASNFILDGDTNHINNTIIDGSQFQNSDSAATVMFINNEDTTSILNGFTITGGTGVFFTNYQIQCGGGIYTFNAGSKIINNKIINNHVEDNIAGGAGIQCWWGGNNTWTIISNNIISNNTSTATGYTAYAGGICVTTNAIINNNIIQYNSCINASQYADGGGIEIDKIPGSNIIAYVFNNIIQYNSIDANSTAWGGGISIQNGMALISNNLFSNNEAKATSDISYGGGICITSPQSITLQNNTFVNNSATTNGGAIYSETTSDEVRNCILWDNSPDEIIGSFSISYSDIKGGWNGEGNIDLDPLFTGTGDHPYSLQDESPCVNTGTPDPSGFNLPEIDLAGNPRIFGSRLDMGAYENQNVFVGVEKGFSKDNFELNIFPNPVINHATIKFNLPTKCLVSMSVCDIKGKQISKIISEEFLPGSHKLSWDSGGLLPGVYFLRIESNGISETKKLLHIN